MRESREVFSEKVTLERVLKDVVISLYAKETYLTRPLSSFNLSYNDIAVAGYSVSSQTKKNMFDVAM